MPLEITHRTTYTYEPRAGHVALRLSLYPSEFDGQTVGHWKVTIDGNEVAPLHTDGFGDRVGLWLSRDGASSLEVVAEGSVSVADKSGVVKGLPRRPPPGVFLRTTKLTAADDAIRDLARSTSRNQPLDTMHAMMEAVGTRIAYAPGTTNANTSAADAIAAGSGVCQDQSHVFIASARALGIPARYVTGYLLAGEEDNELVETHAWIEAFIDHLGWVGFDATNATCPTERYVRLTAGLDADHAAPIRGSVVGTTVVSLNAHVAIAQAQQ